MLLVGDGKTYQHLTQLNCKYDKLLEKLLIFLGDWHILKTYQSTLMKAYYGSGLESIAQYAGYSDSALAKCANFKRTHIFLLKVWEALYRVILKTYTEENQKNDLLQEVSKFVSSSVESKKSPLELMEMVNGIATRELHNKVMLFIDQNIVKNHGNSGVTLSLKIAMPMWLFLYQSEAVIGTLESQV